MDKKVVYIFILPHCTAVEFLGTVRCTFSGIAAALRLATSNGLSVHMLSSGAYLMVRTWPHKGSRNLVQ